MIALREAVRHPSHLWHQPRHEMHYRESAGGLLLLIGVGLLVYWLLPEIRRYARIERM